MATLDRGFNYLHANPHFTRAARVPDGQLRASNHFDLFPDPDLQAIFHQVLKTGEPYTASAHALPFLQTPGQPASYWDWSVQPLRTGAVSNKGPVRGLLLTILPAGLSAQPSEAETEPASGLDRSLNGDPQDRFNEPKGFVETEPASGLDRSLDGDPQDPFNELEGFGETELPGELDRSLEATSPSQESQPVAPQDSQVSNIRLRQVRRMYQHLFESTPDANLMINEQGEILAINHQAEQLFGYLRAELVGQPVEILVPEGLRIVHTAERASYMQNPAARSLAHDPARHQEFSARRKDNSIFPAEINLSPVRVDNNLLVLCVVRDVSQRVSRENDMIHQADLVRLLQDVAVAANEATSINSAFRYTLERVNQQLGWPLAHALLAEEDGSLFSTRIWAGEGANNTVKGARVYDESQPGDQVPNRIQTLTTLPVTGSGTYGITIDSAPGDRFAIFRAVSEALRISPTEVINRQQPLWLTDLPNTPGFLRAREARLAGLNTMLTVPVMAGKAVVGLLEFFHDETLPPDPSLLAVLPHIGVQLGRVVERQRAEQALRKTAAQLRTVITSLPLILWVIDREGRVLLVDGKDVASLPIKPQDLLGKNIFQQFDTRPELLEQIRRALAGEEPVFEIQGKSGKIFQTYLTPYFDVNWAVDGAIGLAFDISERKRMEAELEEVRRRLMDSADAERARLASMLHDGPLQDLFGAYYQIQELRGSAEPSAEENSSRLDPHGLELASRALQTIQSVNATLRVICGELHPNTLVHLGLEKAIRSHAERLQEKLEGIVLHLELEREVEPLSHPLRLGLYRIYQQLVGNAALHSSAADIWVRLHIQSNAVILEVQDNGAGFIPPQHWIELVRQGKVGLATTLERAQNLNGTLQIQSAPGGGTLARVSVPK